MSKTPVYSINVFKKMNRNNCSVHFFGDLETKLELFITNLENLITVNFTKQIKKLVA